MTSQIVQISPQANLCKVNAPRHSKDLSVTICNYTLPVKRLFLPLIASGAFVSMPIVQTYIYLPLIMFCISFIIYWNFPILTTFTNSKPLYYEDLFIASNGSEIIEINYDVKKKFECAFEWSLIFTNSLFTAALADYWLYQTGSNESYVEIIGVTGGILKIFQSINHMNGSVILMVTRHMINKEISQNASNLPDIQLNEIKLDDITHKIEPITLCNQNELEQNELEQNELEENTL